MKFKIGDIVTRMGEINYERNIGIGKDHEITEMRCFKTYSTIQTKDPQTYYYMLRELSDNSIHSAWEDQLELSVIHNSPLGRALL